MVGRGGIYDGLFGDGQVVTAENKNHTIIGSVTRIRLLCGECGKTWEDAASHRPTCPHCKKSLPAWGLPQNIRFDLGTDATQAIDPVSGRSLGPSD